MELKFPLTDRQAATDAALATERWLERAVIGLNLCPFARAAHVKRQIRYAVTAAATADALLEELENAALALVATEPIATETTLLIIPHAMAEFLDFHFFLAEAEALIGRLELKGILQLASFHPRYEFSGSQPEDIENYSNRAPLPVVQLLRAASVARALESFPDATEIYGRNMRTLRELGIDGWRKLWA